MVGSCQSPGWHKAGRNCSVDFRIVLGKAWYQSISHLKRGLVHRARINPVLNWGDFLVFGSHVTCSIYFTLFSGANPKFIGYSFRFCFPANRLMDVMGVETLRSDYKVAGRETKIWSEVSRSDASDPAANPGFTASVYMRHATVTI